MRKMRLLLLAMLLGLALCACGGDDDKNGSKDVTPTESAGKATPTAEPTAEPTKEATPTPTGEPLEPEGDEDGDGASNEWETLNGYDPRTYNDIFRDVELTGDAYGEGADSISSRAILSVSWSDYRAAWISVEESTTLINETIPGYCAPAFSYNGLKNPGSFKVEFVLGENKRARLVDPVIYRLDAENKRWIALETVVSDNVVSAVATEFGTYIVLDRTVYDYEMAKGKKVDLSNAPKDDSNKDGISDYITKLMCDGDIRYSTGAKVFGNLTYDAVQKNADFNDNTFINSDEIEVVTGETEGVYARSKKIITVVEQMYDKYEELGKSRIEGARKYAKEGYNGQPVFVVRPVETFQIDYRKLPKQLFDNEGDGFYIYRGDDSGEYFHVVDEECYERGFENVTVYEASAYVKNSVSGEERFFYRLFFVFESDGGGLYTGVSTVYTSDNRCTLYTDHEKGGITFGWSQNGTKDLTFVWIEEGTPDANGMFHRDTYFATCSSYEGSKAPSKPEYEYFFSEETGYDEEGLERTKSVEFHGSEASWEGVKCTMKGSLTAGEKLSIYSISEQSIEKSVKAWVSEHVEVKGDMAATWNAFSGSLDTDDEKYVYVYTNLGKQSFCVNGTIVREGDEAFFTVDYLSSVSHAVEAIRELR